MASLSFYGHLLASFPGGKDACLPIKLTTGGTLIYQDQVQRDIQESILLSPYCPMGSVYIYDLSRLFRRDFHILTSSTTAWQEIYTEHSGYASSIPVFVAIFSLAMAVSTVMSGFMTIARHSRYPWLLRLSVYFATAETVAIFGIMVRYLYNRYDIGGNSVSLTVMELVTKPHRVAAFVAATLLQFALVQVTVQLFQRDVERKCVVVCGIIMVITSITLSAVSTFALWENQMLNAFHYMIEMSIYLLFSVCLCLRGAESWQAAFSKELVILTAFTILTAWIPPALYVADFYGWWHARMIDQLCPFSTVMCVVIGWYWIQKIYDVEQSLAEGHQLGRRVVNRGLEFKNFHDQEDEEQEGEIEKVENTKQKSESVSGVRHWAVGFLHELV